MYTPNSRLRAPPLNASNMSNGQPRRRDSNGGPAMHLPSTPGVERIFFTRLGERRTKNEMKMIFDQMSAAHSQGHRVPSGHQHEILWMIQQHYPDHPCLGGRQYSPPPGTIPELLHLGQRNGSSAQQRPQASSPNMMPSGTARPATSGVQRLQGMAIDPALANSSMRTPQNAVAPMQMRPSSNTSSQGPTPFSPAAASFARSPAQVPTPAMSRNPSAMSFTPGSPAAFVFQSDQAIRSPSKASPYRPRQAQHSPPFTPGRPPFSPASGDAGVPPQQNPAPPQNGYTAGSAPSRGMFAAPSSRPASAQGQGTQIQSSGQPNFQSSEIRAKIDALVAEDLQKFSAQQAAGYRKHVGNDYNLKWKFINFVREMQRQAYMRRMQRPPAMTAGPPVDPRHAVTGPAAKRRKEPPAVVEQPKSKRPHIDLTIDDPPSVSPPSGPIKDLPIPTHLTPQPANADAHEHALLHGVYLPDLHMRLYSKEEVKSANIVHQQSVRDAQSRLDPIPQNLKSLVQSAKHMATQVMQPATGATTAMEDVRPNEVGDKLDHTASRTASPFVEHPPNLGEHSVGGERCSRSPEQFMENMSEQRANLEYELSFLERQ